MDDFIYLKKRRKSSSLLNHIEAILTTYFDINYPNMDVTRIITNSTFNIGFLLSNTAGPCILFFAGVYYYANKYIIDTYLHSIDELLSNRLEPLLFLCPKEWDVNLYRRFKSAVSIYKNLVKRFNCETSDKRNNFYKQICQLERKWYKSRRPNLPQVIPNKVDGAMNHINFIESSY